MIGSLLAGCAPSGGSAEDLIELALVEIGQGGHPTAGVLAVYLDETGNEELLLLVSLCLPVVGLAQCDEKAVVASPLSEIGRGVRAGI